MSTWCSCVPCTSSTWIRSGVVVQWTSKTNRPKMLDLILYSGFRLGSSSSLCGNSIEICRRSDQIRIELALLAAMECTQQSLYNVQLQGIYITFDGRTLWKARAEGEHKFFTWLLLQSKILTEWQPTSFWLETSLVIQFASYMIENWRLCSALVFELQFCEGSLYFLVFSFRRTWPFLLSKHDDLDF